MILWFFEDIPEFKPVAGFETGFNVVRVNENFITSGRSLKR